jgi:hypothetical protein
MLATRCAYQIRSALACHLKLTMQVSSYFVVMNPEYWLIHKGIVQEAAKSA